MSIFHDVRRIKEESIKQTSILQQIVEVILPAPDDEEREASPELLELIANLSTTASALKAQVAKLIELAKQ